MAMVSVIDTGPGIDRDTLKRIFNPFFTTKSRGLGVGLSISRALIEANGGRLWIDPDYKQGARFHFTLPFA
jgi:signal transduction histidine kinase